MASFAVVLVLIKAIEAMEEIALSTDRGRCTMNTVSLVAFGAPLEGFTTFITASTCLLPTIFITVTSDTVVGTAKLATTTFNSTAFAHAHTVRTARTFDRAVPAVLFMATSSVTFYADRIADHGVATIDWANFPIFSKML